MNFKNLLCKNGMNEGAELKRLEYDKVAKKLTISIIYFKYITNYDIKEFEEELTALPFVDSLELNVEYRIFKGESESSDREILIKALFEEATAISPLLGSNLIFSKYDFSDEEITIQISQPSVFKIIESENIAKRLESIIYKTRGEFLFLNGDVQKDGSVRRVIFELSEGHYTQKAKDAFELAETKTEKINKNATQTHSKPQTPGGSGEGDDWKFRRKKKNDDPNVICGSLVKPPFSRIDEVREEGVIYSVEGEIFDVDFKELKTEKSILTFGIYDGSYSLSCKVFLSKGETASAKEKMKEKSCFRVCGVYGYDTFAKESCLSVKKISVGVAKKKRFDDSKDKRVELHAHTTMSEVDGVVNVKSLVERAVEWGHSALAITDHGVLQAFPGAMTAAGDKIKILYGIEAYMIDDTAGIIENANDMDFDQEFVVFDIETTGLSSVRDMITEIGAVKIKGKEVVDTFQSFVNPGISIPRKIVELTGITDDMVADKPNIEIVLDEFLGFAGKSVLVAHNSSFDMSFLKFQSKKRGKKIKNCVVDTLRLSRLILKDLKKHKLDSLAKHYDIEMGSHHRADDDAATTAKIFLKMIEEIESRGVKTLNQVNSMLNQFDIKNMNRYHIVILVKNQAGIKDLYRLVSDSHIKYLHKKPGMPRSEIENHRENLILGSACDAGEIYKAILNDKEEEEIEETARFYDYLEIQPLGNPSYLVRQGKVESYEALKDINKRIVSLGEKVDRPVVATGDVHFSEPEDEIYRRIIMAGNGFSDADEQAPLYFRTTKEMLSEFEYLGDDKAREVVITNTNLIADMTENVIPIPRETFPPKVEGAEEEFRNLCFGKAARIYGDNLPKIVEDRLEKEVNDIIKNGYAAMYIIARKLVVKSNEDGYLVGSRGSVGSSFAATMSDITEVNPLRPHYVCGNCKYSDFDVGKSYGCGPDMPEKDCPRCATPLKKDGYNIPFETFLGFNGDKEPDIDLNFAGEYQAVAHRYTGELFGEDYVYKAGTIGTIAEKTAYGYIRKYFEDRGRDINSKELKRLQIGCTGIKKTSGQHPGGIMVVPTYKEINDITPIQYPANDPKSGVKTTHFDYHSIEGRILKLDILGHDVPTIIRQLEEITGLSGLDVPLDDEETISIFSSTKALNIIDEEYECDTGSPGIPEFGTRFVRRMLVETKPSSISEIICICGLSHGTDVWTNNAQNLIRDGVVGLSEVISTRDDIMIYLIDKGLDKAVAFKIMEKVRKGRGINDEEETCMRECDVPEWYINSCKIIKYMFPKAHAVAYVMMSFRIAWFKVNRPLAFYAAYFSTKVDIFDANLICAGVGSVREKLKEIRSSEAKTAKDEELSVVLEVVDEMYSRGFEFCGVSLYESFATKFKVADGKVMPPLRSLGGIGENAAIGIFEAAREKEFKSIDDLKKRGKATKTAIEALREHGCLTGMPDSDQLDIFSMFGV